MKSLHISLSVLVAAVAGCVESSVVECSPTLICPQGTTCSHVTGPDEDICATADQISACAGVAEGEMCTYAGSPPSTWCHDGVCIASACGNNRMDPGEVCDDGNTVAGDGTCSGDCASTEECGNGIIDPLARDTDGNPIANEACDDGNRISADGCSSTCKAEQLRWSQVGEKPGVMVGSAVAYDPVRRRVVMFGGERSIPVGMTLNHVVTNAIYEWNGSDWARIPHVAGPAARRNAGMVYDAARRRMVIFGGEVVDLPGDITPLGDHWEWDGVRWTLRNVPNPPPARSKFGMVYDSARKKVVIFGGTGRDATGAVPLADTWEFDGTSWTEITSAVRPAPRIAHVMTYDPVRGVAVMAGGYDGDQDAPTFPRDTWEYDGTWRLVTTAPTDLDYGAAMAFDPATNTMVTYGGVSDYLGTSQAWSMRTLSYDGSTWSALSPTTTPGVVLQFAAMVADVHAGTVVMFGGEDDFSDRYNDTYLWDGDSWDLAVPFVPPSLMNAGSALDPLRGVTWLFGGQDATQTVTSNLWSFDGTTWARHTATGPSARMMASVAYDPLRRELVVFGGAIYSGNDFVPTTGETWTFDGTTWSSLTPSMSPSPRFGATAYFDPNRGRIVLFGGSGANLATVSDMWEWTGTTWQPITPSTLPSQRGFAGGAFDVSRDSSVLFGGFTLNASSVPVAATDTWEYDGVTWTRAPAPNPMPRRVWSELAYDAAGRHITLFGGIGLGSGVFGDAWQWSGTTWEQVLTAENPPPRGGHVTFAASDGRGVLIHGGGTELDSGGTPFADTWRLRYENDESFEQCLLSVDDDGDGLMGCSDPDCWAYCTPLCPPGGVCDASAPRCGDGVCNTALESCRNCVQDCATCVAACGDAVCEGSETLTSCRGDCSP